MNFMPLEHIQQYGPAVQSLKVARYMGRVQKEMEAYQKIIKELVDRHEVDIDLSTGKLKGDAPKEFTDEVEKVRAEEVDIDHKDCVIKIADVSNVNLEPGLLVGISFLFKD